MKSMKKVLGGIREFEFDIVDASCCAMSGRFGLEAEHFLTQYFENRSRTLHSAIVMSKR